MMTANILCIEAKCQTLSPQVFKNTEQKPGSYTFTISAKVNICSLLLLVFLPQKRNLSPDNFIAHSRHLLCCLTHQFFF